MRADSYGRDRYTRQANDKHVGKQGFKGIPTAPAANQNLLLVLAGIAVLFLVILVIRFIAFSPTASDYSEVRAQLEQENAQTLELEADNNELQGEINSMQGLIQEYNELKK